MSLTIGPVDDSPPQFQDHLESDWGGIQLQGANCFQWLLETLNRVSLCTLLGRLANRNWHQLGTQWSEIRMECRLLGAAAGTCATADKMTIAIATLLEKNSFSEDDFLLRRDWMHQWIVQMTEFQGSGGTRTCILPLAHGCRALSNILSTPRREDFVSADCRLNTIATIVESLVSQTNDVKEWNVRDVEAVGDSGSDHPSLLPGRPHTTFPAGARLSNSRSLGHGRRTSKPAHFSMDIFVDAVARIVVR